MSSTSSSKKDPKTGKKERKMKRIAILLLVILPIALASVSFTDYTSPTSSGQEAFLNGNFNFKSGNQDQASYNGLLGGNYLNYYNSLPINWRIGAEGNLELLRGSADGAEANTGYAKIGRAHV